MKKYFAIIFACFLLINTTVFAQMLMQPYIQAVDMTSAVIMVESESTAPIFVQYRFAGDEFWVIAQTTSTRIAEQKRGESYVHRIKLVALDTNAKYQYRAIYKKDTTEIFEFYTAARPGESFRFLAMGDSRSFPKIHNVIAGEALKRQPRMSVYTGDLCMNHQYSSWKDEFFVENQLRLAASAPFYNAIGNHEDWRQNTRAFLEAPKSESGEEYFYSFDYGDVHFLILSTEHGVTPGSKQWRFAQTDLGNTDRKWKVVVFHIPAYCFGGHDGNKRMQRMTTEIFEPAGVDLIFNGHSHFYQRNFTGGIHHVIVAGAGAPLYTPKKGDITVKTAKEYNYAIVDASPNKLEMNVYDMYGNVLDSLTLEK
ncbi:MAG: metallophosphoesterase [Candidatus Kapaibacterium sp.]